MKLTDQGSTGFLLNASVPGKTLFQDGCLELYWQGYGLSRIMAKMGHTLNHCSQDRGANISQFLPLRPDGVVDLRRPSGVGTKARVPWEG